MSGVELHELPSPIGEGLALLALGHADAALDRLTHGASLVQAAGDIWALALCRYSICHALLEAPIARLNEALAEGHQALDLFCELGDNEWVASSYKLIGVVHERLGNLDQALETFRLSLAAGQAEDDADWFSLALSHESIGNLHRRRGRLVEARTEHDQALECAKRVDQSFESVSLLARCHNSIAVLDGILGDLDGALEGFRRAFGFAELMGRLAAPHAKDLALACQAKYLSHMADVRRDKGHPANEVLSDYQRALQWAIDAKDRAQQVRCLGRIGSIYNEVGSPGRASLVFSRALRVVKDIGNPEERTSLLGCLADAYLDLGYLRGAMEYNRRALTQAERLGSPAQQAHCHLVLGHILGKLGKADQELAAYSRALVLSETAGNVPDQMAVHAILGIAYERRGDIGRVHHHYGRSINLAERMRGSLGSMEDRRVFNAPAFDVLCVRMVSLCLHLGHTEQAFDYAERAHSRAFLDALGSARLPLHQSVPPDALASYDRLRQEADALHRNLRSLDGSSDDGRSNGGPTSDLRSTLRAELVRCEALSEAELRRLTEEHPDFAACQAILPPDLPALQRHLRDVAPPRTAVLEYIVDETESVALIVTADQLRVQQGLAVTLDDIRNTIFETVDGRLRYRLEVDGTDEPLLRLRNLRTRLIDPLQAAGLLDGIERLWIVPHRHLHYVPWAALPRGDPALGLTYLVEEFDELVVLPSAGVLPFCLRHRQAAASVVDRLYAAGSPDPTRPLRGAEREVALVAACYPDQLRHGPGTTRADALVGSRDRGVIHLALHGVYDPEFPQQSGLEFADGRLTLRDLLNDWRLTAELVVLSCCHGGQGKVSWGDEVAGLTRAVLHAGAAAVLASLYTIRDDWAPGFMASVHEGRRAGKRTAEALADAQRDAIKDGVEPRLWAPFLLVGDG